MNSRLDVRYHALMAEGQVEREVKLEAGVGFAVPDLTGVMAGVRAEALPDARLQATYVDTPDLRLLRHGLALRHRHDRTSGAGAEAEWTLKLPKPADGRLVVRRELNWPGSGTTVPAEADSLVRALRRSTPLAPVARLVTQRRRIALRDTSGEKLAEIDDDVVSVMDGRKLAARFREVEV